MLKATNISFRYSADGPDIIRNLNLEMGAGAIHGILGPNGSGKTTFLNLLSGELVADEGTLEINGEDLERDHIAWLPTHPFFYPLITGREYLALFELKNAGFDVEGWNQVFELPLDMLVDEYSSGMKKKLALMGVLSYDRPVLMLDEPFNNLDLDTNRIVADLLRKLAEKGTLVHITSHILEILTETAAYIHTLEEGRISQTVPHADFDNWKRNYRTQAVDRAIRQVDDLLEKRASKQ